MKKLLPVLLYMLFTVGAHARSDSLSRNYYVQVGYVYSMPIGQFSYRSNNSLLMGQNSASSGMSCQVGMNLKKKFYLGLQFTDVKYGVNQNALYTLQYHRYSNSDFYTTVTTDLPYIEIPSVAAVIGYSFPYHSVAVAPYLSAGMAWVQIKGNRIAAIHRKEKNDNYAEDIVQNADLPHPAFIYPGIGVRLNKKISGRICGSITIQYNTGVLHYALRDEQTDYLGNTSVSTASINQDVSVLQIQLGIHLWFRKFRN